MNMIKLFIPIIILSLACVNIIGQEYEIISITPEYLVPGKSNNITVVINKNLEAGDSVINAGIMIRDGVGGRIFPETYILSTTCDRVDSIFKVTMDMPDEDIYESGNFCLRTTDIQDSIEYHKPLFIGTYVNSLHSEICLVSTDTENRNVVIWANSGEPEIDSVNIYKETSASNVYEKIGSKAIEELSEFVDLESIQAQNSNRYAITIIDNSGIESEKSLPHKTLHLTSSLGLNGSVNLIWDAYEGFDYSTYYIYRSYNSKNNMVKIAEIPGNLFSFTDLYPPLGQLYYQIAVIKPEGCTSISLKSTEATYASSVSNIVERKSTTAVALGAVESSVSVYPNPVTDKMYISSDNELFISSLTITDMMGRIIQIHNEVNKESGIDISVLNSGSYFVHINTPNKIISRMIIKQ